MTTFITVTLGSMAVLSLTVVTFVCFIVFKSTRDDAGGYLTREQVIESFCAINHNLPLSNQQYELAPSEAVLAPQLLSRIKLGESKVLIKAGLARRYNRLSTVTDRALKFLKSGVVSAETSVAQPTGGSLTQLTNTDTASSRATNADIAPAQNAITLQADSIDALDALLKKNLSQADYDLVWAGLDERPGLVEQIINQRAKVTVRLMKCEPCCVRFTAQNFYGKGPAH